MNNRRFVGTNADGTPAERIFNAYKAELFFLVANHSPYAVVFTTDNPKEIVWKAIILDTNTTLESHSGYLGIVGKLKNYYKETKQ